VAKIGKTQDKGETDGNNRRTARYFDERHKKPEDLIGENGLLKQLTKRLLERVIQTELTEHLGYR
jgi:transposase-like protein